MSDKFIIFPTLKKEFDYAWFVIFPFTFSTTTYFLLNFNNIFTLFFCYIGKKNICGHIYPAAF